MHHTSITIGVFLLQHFNRCSRQLITGACLINFQLHGRKLNAVCDCGTCIVPLIGLDYQCHRMSADDQQMESESSSQSISSREPVSSVSSSYEYESRLSMSSFAATALIAGLIIMWISMITLIITLTMMLQSCRSQTSGIIKNQRSYYDDHYFKNVAFHMELNRLDRVELPSICKNYAASYVSEGQLLRDLNLTIFMAEKYFLNLRPPDHGLTLVLMDIDYILPSSIPFRKSLKNRYKISCCSNLLRFNDYVALSYCLELLIFGADCDFPHHQTCMSLLSSFRDCIEDTIKSRCILMLRLYNRIKERGWPLILVTKRAQNQQDAITKYLVSEGYLGWESLMMRSTEEVMLSNLEYFSRKIRALERQEYHVGSVISSNLDALTGLSVGKRVFKLPNMKF